MKNRGVIKIIILIVLAAVLIFLFRRFNLLETLNPTVVREWIEGKGLYAPLLFILIYIVAAVTFLPGSPFTIMGGVLFGAVQGTVYVTIGATLGAAIAFLISRVFGRTFVEGIVKDKFKKIFAYDKKLEKNGLKVVLFLRFIPLFPFNGLNFALGLTRVSFRDYFIGTLIGMIPATFVFVYFGDSLAEAKLVNIVVAIVLILLMSAVLPVYRRFRKTHNS